MEDTRTLADLAKESLAVQDACNLSGVVISWGQSIRRLRELEPNLGTNELNTHPINQLWADKVAQLTGTQGAHFADLTRAYEDVKAYARAENMCDECGASVPFFGVSKDHFESCSLYPDSEAKNENPRN